jgi:heme A synthase
MAITAGILFIIQSGVGALVVLWKKPIYIADLHLAIATAVWACMVLLATMAVRQTLIAPQAVVTESESTNEYHATSY